MSAEEREVRPIHPQLIVGVDPQLNGEGGQVCIITELPDHPGEVGVMLADVVRHYGRAYGGEDQKKVVAAVMEIWSILQAEMSNPTDEIHVVMGGELAVTGGQVTVTSEPEEA